MIHLAKLLIIIILLVCLSATLLNNKLHLIEYSIIIPFTQVHLPIAVASLLSVRQFDKISIQMGHFTNQMIRFPRGITAIIHNRTQLSQNTLYALSQIFSFSYNPAFQLYLMDQRVLLLSDPNDRLCTEQIQSLLKIFFPCKDYSSYGLQFLINVDKLFNQFLGIDIQWTPKQIIFKFIKHEKQSFEPGRSRKINCGWLQIKKWQQHYQNSLNQQLTLKYSANVINKWYSPQKTLTHKVQLNINSSANFKIITRLPQGLSLKFIEYPLIINQSIQLFYIIVKRLNFNFIIFNINMLNNRKTEKSQRIKQNIQYNFLIVMHLEAMLPGFQKFQTIAGGGQQIMNIPILSYDNSQDANQMSKLSSNFKIVDLLYSNIVSIRLLEPDFSIPFHVITFTTGIIGYLWLTLIRLHRVQIKTYNALDDQYD